MGKNIYLFINIRIYVYMFIYFLFPACSLVSPYPDFSVVINLPLGLREGGAKTSENTCKVNLGRSSEM